MKMNKATYINQLPLTTQSQIKEEIIEHLKINVGLAPYQEEYQEALDNAMNSRLIDLEEVIDISEYI